MPSPLSKKTVWLVGASSGIGEAFAKQVSATGCNLILSARREEKLKDVAEACGGAHVVALDVCERASVEKAYSEIKEKYGAVDVLIANAGTHKPTRVKHFNVDEYRRVLEVNFFGVLNCFEAVLPDMIERRQGHLVAVSSIAGYRGLPRAAAYGASKSALTHFCESIRLDLEPLDVDVTVVSPGFVKTPLTDKNDFDMPFLMEAEDAAKEMLKGIEQRKYEVHFPWKFTYILKFLRVIPFSLYHRLVRKTVKTDKFND